MYLLTAKASWNSKTSISFKDNPALSRTLGVLYVGLERKRIKNKKQKINYICFDHRDQKLLNGVSGSTNTYPRSS